MTVLTNQQNEILDILNPVFESQKAYFESGETRSYSFRVKQLKALKATIKKYEEDIYDALRKDLGKPLFEAYTSEVGFVYQEIKHTLSHLKGWMKPEKVSTSIVHLPSSSKIIKEPLGNILIVSPWNYPFQLVFAPIVAAISTGNTAIIKPSEFTPNTSAMIEKIIKDTFDSKYMHVVQGEGHVVIPPMMDNFRFDHVFFTGSVRVGKIIAEQAAKKLTPVTLELGGKSPAIVDKNVSVDVTAKRLIYGKLFNTGQTCVAPDYLLVHEKVKDKLVASIIKQIKTFYGENPQESESYGRIVDKRRFDVLVKYLEEGNIVFGGEHDREDHYIAPTLIDNVSMEDSIMQTEIFGPILPIITFSEIDEVLDIVKQNPYPLALYLFTVDSGVEEKVINNIRFGGGCVNNSIVHLTNPNLPFGGVGYSGMGRYHGKNSFDALSHQKSIMKTKFFYDNELKYPPYTNTKISIAKKFFE